MDQRTSWVAVQSFPEQSNAPPIQYYAQSGGTPLSGPNASGQTKPYLVFKSIPANAEGPDSFPLAPFSGINAPDPLVDATVDIATYHGYELSQYSWRETSRAFTYQTPMVRFINEVTRLIDVRVPMNIPDNDSAGGTSLAVYLETLLTNRFISAQEPVATRRPVKLGVRNAFDGRVPQTVAESPGQGDEIIAELLVLQRLPVEYLPNDSGTLAAALAQEMQDWFNEVQSLTSGGYYDIGYSGFAALTNAELPVLRLRDLWIGPDQLGLVQFQAVNRNGPGSSPRSVFPST